MKKKILEIFNKHTVYSRIEDVSYEEVADEIVAALEKMSKRKPKKKK